MEAWKEELYVNELYHHGIKNQQWGVRNGPPYPLKRAVHNEVVSASNAAHRRANKALGAEVGGAIGAIGLSMLGPAGIAAGSVVRGASILASYGLQIASSISGYRAGIVQAEKDYQQGNREANIANRKAYSGRGMIRNAAAGIGLGAGSVASAAGGTIAGLAVGGLPGAAIMAGSAAVSALMSYKAMHKSVDFWKDTGENLTYRDKDREEYGK